MNSVMQDLRKLIIENPDLEVIPFVAEDSNDSDYSYTIARVGKARVESYVLNPFDDESVLIKSEGFYRFEDDYRQAHYEICEVNISDITKSYQNLDWTKGIFVYIEAY